MAMDYGSAYVELGDFDERDREIERRAAEAAALQTSCMMYMTL